MRIGHGYDVHKLVEGRKLIIGGVDIEFEKGLLGHSDADVLTHAMRCLALRDLETSDFIFPITTPRIKMQTVSNCWKKWEIFSKVTYTSSTISTRR